MCEKGLIRSHGKDAMLQLINVKKDYYAAGETVQALRGVSLSFRKNEFVSILGPSGCGKTTLLNIIGGLDKYTEGELTIAGKPTSSFSDRDWDVYRNHRVGFVFQSYNLIPHQTILQNVELALTIGGMAKEERIAKAKATLDRVGLRGLYKKRPNQLSGGQCQRVAIARALVNDPEILLADEPTGALDTKTSAQILDLIREIAGERLVIMVTHNPELAEIYSTRIVQLLDGQVVSDSNPYSAEEEAKESFTEGENPEKGAKKQKKERAKMSLLTAFRLSARNLISKRRRTALVGIAGSIGIIGISMVLSISTGIRGYIASMQDDMLSGNPIQITETTYDLNTLTGLMKATENSPLTKLPERVYVNSLIKYLAKTNETVSNFLVKNEISKDYVDYVLSMPEESRAAIKLGYGIDLSHSIFTEVKQNATASPTALSVTALTATYTSILKETEGLGQYASYASSLGSLFAEIPNNLDYIASQYDVMAGRLPNAKDEIVLVLDAESSLSDLFLAKLGFFNQEEFLNLIYDATEDELFDEAASYREYFDFDDILEKKLTFYPNDALYNKNEGMAAMKGAFSYNAYAKDMEEEGLTLNIVGILQPKEEISFGCLGTGIYYTKAFTDHVLEVNRSSEIVSYLLEKGQDNFQSMTMNGMPYGITYTYTYIFRGEEKTATGFVGSPLSMNDMASSMGGMMGGGSGSGAGGSSGGSSSGNGTGGMGGGMGGMGSLNMLADMMTLSLRDLGGATLPSSITIYPTTFDEKDLVTDWLDKWNDEELTLTFGETTLEGDARSQVTYTDNLEIVISLINAMIDVVSTALIAFTSVSLLVSSVMIGILTYVSVTERIKEIGVIRSLGGRKKDVKRLFNAETFIIGTLAGLIAILTTALLSAFLNFLVYTLAGVTVTAYLPLKEAVVMIALSVGLTLISGLIPAAAAARKDPVVALRTE